MPIIYAFLQALFTLIISIVSLFKWVILIRAIISWVNPDPYNPVVRILAAVTDPILKPFRRILPPYKTGGLDFSPVFAILFIVFIEVFLKSLFYQLSMAWQ